MRRLGLIAMVGLVALGVSCQLMSGLSDLGLGDLATGTACTHPAQCQSEQCVDLVCCEVACDTDCVGCNLPGSEGICAPYEARTDPDGDCPGMGLCDGQGTCTAGNHAWSLAYGDWYDQSAYDVAVDGDRNIVVVGEFRGEFVVGSDHWQAGNEPNLFVIKLSPAGVPIWTRTYGDDQEQVATSVAIDAQGNIAVCGRNRGTLDFGDGQLWTAEENGSHFLVVFDGDGDSRWSKSVPGHYGARVAMHHSSGDVILAARLTDEATFGSDTFTPVGPEDMYIARYAASSSDLQWATHVESPDVTLDPEQPLVSVLGGLTVDSQGATVFAGGFLTSLDFGATELVNNKLRSDAYVAKLDSTGALAWANHYSGGTEQFVSGLSLHEDDLVIAGPYVGPLQLGTTPLPSYLGRADVFVARLSPAGTHLMSKGFAGGGSLGDLPSYPNSVAVDAIQGNMVLTGVLASPISFGGEQLKSAGLFDMFFAKLTPTGNHLYSKRFGDEHEQHAIAGAIDGQGDVVIAGQFQGTLAFSADSPLQGAGEYDIFLAKFTP